MGETLVEKVESVVSRFSNWLDGYGETSYDHQSFFASTTGRWAKTVYYKNRLLGTAVVAPMILCEAFVPSALPIPMLHCEHLAGTGVTLTQLAKMLKS